MFRICLVTMPFANLAIPSIALTQLRAITRERFAGKVSVEIVYLTHDFGQYLGLEDYNWVSNSMDALYAGLGDWFFRAAAFPELADNTDSYLRRFFPQGGANVDRVKQLIARKRPKLDQYLDTLITRYALDRAQIVGFTSMFMQNAGSFAVARKVKARNPKVITIIGGPNCESPMGRVIAQRVPDIDFVFAGSALKSFPDFVQRCLDGDVVHRSAPGIFSKDVATVPPGPNLAEELSIDVPIPLEYDDFMRRFEAYFSASHPAARAEGLKPIVPIETSRGCWWGEKAHCTFCGLNGATMAYRAMKPALAIEQFKAAFRYAPKAGLIQVVDNILPKHYISQVLPLLDTPEGMEIFYEVKADLTRAEMAILAKARVNRIQPGIESLATSTLKLMKKGTSAFQNLIFLKNSAAFGIHPYWNLLIGFPGEGPEVFRRYTTVLPLLTHLVPPTGVYPIRFDRFSPYHKEASRYQLDLHPMDFYASVYPFDDADLHEFAYYFSDHNLDADYAVAVTDWIQTLRPLVREWRARWSGQSGAVPPALRFIEGTDVVYDSRSGSVIERAIGPVGKALLQRAVRPIAADELIRAGATMFGDDVVSAFQRIEAEGLLFREGDRVLSLVMGADDEVGDPATQDELEERRGADPVKFLPMVSA